MGDERMIRVGIRSSSDQVVRADGWLSNQGDKVILDVQEPGRVTLELAGGWSKSGIAYCHLTFVDAASVDLAERRSRAERVERSLAALQAEVPPEALRPIRDWLADLVPEGRG